MNHRSFCLGFDSIPFKIKWKKNILQKYFCVKVCKNRNLVENKSQKIYVPKLICDSQIYSIESIFLINP